ncbi:MAG: tryptophan 7-halogenase [Marinicaulis sp.]|nr:tryptophan 7-halogenase [Marinicaulis sp.]
MGAPIRDYTIVGGGTSGWIAACYLARIFEGPIKKGAMTITVIESPDVGIIGVGESTARPMADLLRIIGIKESEFIKRCNVTFKLGGLFTNWETDENGKNVTWVNPFSSQTDFRGLNPGYIYATHGMHDNGGPITENYTEAMSNCPAIIAARKGPKIIGVEDYKTDIPYSYHMDAIEFAKMLQERGKELGVRQILDHVNEVKLDERGFVKELDLRENGVHPIEFVIDATGFASIIIGKALENPFESFDKYLLNDRAAVIQLPHEDPTKLEPTSRATGMNAGWSFRVPLFNRVGTGYVYSSKFLSDDEAVDEFKAFIGPAAKDAEPRIIRMRIGKARYSWVKNCLALGMSSGFVEPLEATAIYSVQVALDWFRSYLPDSDFDPAVTRRFNELNDRFYSEVVDFISLLFYASNRDDTAYWRAVRHEMEIPQSLKENLELWRSTMPTELDLPTNIFFSPTSYRAALFGKRFFKGRKYAQAAAFPEQEWRHYVGMRQQQIKQLLGRLPDQYQLLRSIRGEDNAQSQPTLNLTNILGGRGI